MAKFNLIEHISKNKSTFFSSLTEGQFSWMTQDTGQQIGSQDENKIPVYMFDDKGKYWFERDYDGYGVFGGKDYYELLDQMNGGRGDRSRGIDLAFDKEETSAPILYPALITRPGEFNYRTHDFTQEAKHDPNQSWYDASYEEDEDDDYGSDNDDEDYGYNDEDKELEEGYQGQFYAPEYLEQKYGKEMASKITDEIDEMDENSYDRFTEFTSAEEVEDYISDIKDMLNLNEGEAAYEYEKGKEAGEKIEKKKMKVSELKAKIKEMVLSEMNGPAVEDEQYDFLREIEDMLSEESPMNDPRTKQVIQMLIDMDVDGETMEYILRQVGMEDQMANQLVNNPAEYAASLNEAEGDEDEDYNAQSLFKSFKEEDLIDDRREYDVEDLMSTYPGLSKEEAEKLEDMLQNLNEAEEDEVPLTPKVKKFIDKTIADSKADDSFEDLMDADWFDNELIDELIDLFPNEDYDRASKEVMNYISQSINLGENKINEAEEDEEVDAEAADDVTADDTVVDTEVDVTTNEVDPNVKAVQDALTQAQAAAQQLGDPKLTDQIGNTITFFTRSHVVEKPKGAVAEEMNLNVTEDITVDIEKKIKSGEIDPKEVEAAAKKAMSGDSTDLALMMAGFGKMFETKKEDKKEKNVAEDLNEAMFPMLKKILK